MSLILWSVVDHQKLNKCLSDISKIWWWNLWSWDIIMLFFPTSHSLGIYIFKYTNYNVSLKYMCVHFTVSIKNMSSNKHTWTNACCGTAALQFLWKIGSPLSCYIIALILCTRQENSPAQSSDPALFKIYSVFPHK